MAGRTLVPAKTGSGRAMLFLIGGVWWGRIGQQGAVGDARGLLWLRLDMGSKQHGK